VDDNVDKALYKFIEATVDGDLVDMVDKFSKVCELRQAQEPHLVWENLMENIFYFKI
jgi:hypothetical protein